MDSVLAQTSPLEKKVSFPLTDDTIEAVLKKITQQTGINFSYNPEAIEAKKLTHLDATNNETVESVLNKIFQGKVKPVVKGKYVILKKEKISATNQHIILTGYVLDNETGNKISEASIYEKNTLASAVSNPAGYYRIKVPVSQPDLVLSVSKQAYHSQYVHIQSEKVQNLDIRLTPLMDTIASIQPKMVFSVTPDTTHITDGLTNIPVPENSETWKDKLALLGRKAYLPLVNFLTSAEQKIHFSNIKDTISRDFQVSFLPYIGTNHVLSANTEVDYSLNIFAGYTKGVRKAEVGGFLNINRQDVKYLQFAGFGNLVGGNVTGVQVGGFFNHVSGETDGVQVAGFANHQIGSVFGVQVASFGNYVWYNVYGIQVSGFANFTGGNLDGMQLGGFANAAVGNVKGTQLAPVFNLAGKLKNGWQIGLINFADSAGKAHQVGLLSFSRKGGYRRLELSYNELQNVNLTFKTGVPGFYNILTAGITPFADKKVLNFGYGMGATWLISKKWGLDFNLTGFQLTKDTLRWFKHGMFRLGITTEFKFARHFSIAAGPSVSLWLSGKPYYEYADFYTDVPRYTFWNETVKNTQIMAWGGFQVALRLTN
jgi:hypothetical protein